MQIWSRAVFAMFPDFVFSQMPLLVLANAICNICSCHPIHRNTHTYRAETKYEWQNKAKCPSYCLEVSSCKSGAGLRVKKCGGTSKQKWKRDGSVIRPSCSSSLYLSDGEVKKGSSSVDFSSSGKFEIRKSGRCLTQMHHPRDGEPVEFRSCTKARRSNTSKWVWK